ncbi:hypothetical protein [Candidatus Harpocratesius sp.]
MHISFQLEENYFHTNHIYPFTLTLINKERDIEYFIKNIEIIHENYDSIYIEEVNQTLSKQIWLFPRMITRKIFLKIDKQIPEVHYFRFRVYIRNKLENNTETEQYIEFPRLNIKINLGKTYRAFISRSVRVNESQIPDFISNEISKWGFQNYTVGIPPLKKDYSDTELIL